MNKTSKLYYPSSNFNFSSNIKKISLQWRVTNGNGRGLPAETKYRKGFKNLGYMRFERGCETGEREMFGIRCKQKCIK